MTRSNTPSTITKSSWVQPSVIAGIALVALASCSRSCSRQEVPDEIQERAQPLSAETSIQEQLKADIDELELELAALRDEKQRLEEQLPEPHRVANGQNHWQIAYDFLTEDRGLDSEAARRELARTALVDPIVQGFQIWNFHNGEDFGSFATQGDAPVSPGVLSRVKTQEAAEERQRLTRKVAALQGDLDTRQAKIASLESRIGIKTEEVAALRTYIDAQQEYEENLLTRIAGLEERLNSVYYTVGTSTQLRADGKVEDSFLSLGRMRLGDIESEDFDRRLDLRESPRIELRARDFDVSRIEGLELLPNNWEKNSDYRVSITDDGEMATIRFLEPNRFRLKTIVLVVSS